MEQVDPEVELEGDENVFTKGYEVERSARRLSAATS